MEKQRHQSSMNSRKSIPLGVLICAFCSFPHISPTRAQLTDDLNVPKQRQIHNTFAEDQEKGIDATNPIKFLNKLRQATALDNATAPSDAIDDALKAFDTNEFDSSNSDTSTPSLEGI